MTVLTPVENDCRHCYEDNKSHTEDEPPHRITSIAGKRTQPSMQDALDESCGIAREPKCHGPFRTGGYGRRTRSKSSQLTRMRSVSVQ